MKSKIFVICTPGDSIREESLNKELSAQINVPLEIEYFPAYMDFRMPRRGINKSHRAIVQKAKDLDLDQVCVLEDDVMFLCDTALAKFINASMLIPKDADLFLNGIYDGDIGMEYSFYAEVSGKISGLACYVVKKQFYDKFLTADEAWNIDAYLSMELSPKMYVMYPFTSLQHEFVSYNLGGQTSHNYRIFKNNKYKIHGK